MNGAQKLAKIRRGQIKKGFTVDHDINNNRDGQLTSAARMLMTPQWDRDNIRRAINNAPPHWNRDVWEGLMNKPYAERLLVAASFLVAQYDKIMEIDRREEEAKTRLAQALAQSAGTPQPYEPLTMDAITRILGEVAREQPKYRTVNPAATVNMSGGEFGVVEEPHRRSTRINWGDDVIEVGTSGPFDNEVREQPTLLDGFVSQNTREDLTSDPEPAMRWNRVEDPVRWQYVTHRTTR